MRLWLFLRGVAMGLAEVVPGVSGGTIAFVTGIYDELIESLARIDWRCFAILKNGGIAGLWQHVNGTFLLTLVAGMALGIVSFARIMSYALAHYQPIVWGFFFGLIVLSVVMIAKIQPIRTLLWAAPLGLLAGLGAASLPTGQVDASLWLVALGGAIAVSAWLLPAVSGSFMLLVLGLYQTVIDAVTYFHWPVLVALASGCVAGLLTITKVLRWAMTNIRAPLLCFLTGFMVGALPRLWPWQWSGERLLPAAYELQSSLSAFTPLVCASAVLGAVLLWLLTLQRA
ncbi:MAG: DUF368 domain-containing protein [Pseudomonadales bacterium]